jgi:hypothetical protein
MDTTCTVAQDTLTNTRLPFFNITPRATVTIKDRFGVEHKGKAVMLGRAGWVLNMGGRWGTPAIATPANTIKVVRG